MIAGVLSMKKKKPSPVSYTVFRPQQTTCRTAWQQSGKWNLSGPMICWFCKKAMGEFGGRRSPIGRGVGYSRGSCIRKGLAGDCAPSKLSRDQLRLFVLHGEQRGCGYLGPSAGKSCLSLYLGRKRFAQSAAYSRPPTHPWPNHDGG
jgi:hypothetical protein